MENYKEKYEDGLECIQEILSGAGDSIKTSILRKRLQPFFPELKGIEDEVIRKAIISGMNALKNQNKETFAAIPIDDCITWLEKQDNKKQVEHLKLKAGHWYICHRPYCCRADNLTVKEGGF